MMWGSPWPEPPSPKEGSTWSCWQGLLRAMHPAWCPWHLWRKQKANAESSIWGFPYSDKRRDITAVAFALPLAASGTLLHCDTLVPWKNILLFSDYMSIYIHSTLTIPCSPDLPSQPRVPQHNTLENHCRKLVFTYLNSYKTKSSTNSCNMNCAFKQVHLHLHLSFVYLPPVLYSYPPQVPLQEWRKPRRKCRNPSPLWTGQWKAICNCWVVHGATKFWITAAVNWQLELSSHESKSQPQGWLFTAQKCHPLITHSLSVLRFLLMLLS